LRTKKIIPEGSVWHAAEPALIFVDRERSTCARALLEGQFSEIKALCRYNVHRSPFVRGVIRLYFNTFLLTNISTLSLHCLGQKFNDTTEVVHLTDIQSIHTFDCNCDKINADEFRIADLHHCNTNDNISSVYNTNFPINLAYLSQYFGDD